jgi:hypothetical protein
MYLSTVLEEYRKCGEKVPLIPVWAMSGACNQIHDPVALLFSKEPCTHCTVSWVSYRAIRYSVEENSMNFLARN